MCSVSGAAKRTAENAQDAARSIHSRTSPMSPDLRSSWGGVRGWGEDGESLDGNTWAPQLPEALIPDLGVCSLVHATFQANPNHCQGLPTLSQNHSALKSHPKGTASCGDQALGQRTHRGRTDQSQGRGMYCTCVGRECVHFQSILGHSEDSWGPIQCLPWSKPIAGDI